MPHRGRRPSGAGLHEAATLAHEYKPLGKIHENIALQTEFARKVFEIAVQGAQESASTARQSTTEAVKIIQDRVKESFEDIRASVRPALLARPDHVEGAGKAECRSHPWVPRKRKHGGRTTGEIGKPRKPNRRRYLPSFRGNDSPLAGLKPEEVEARRRSMQVRRVGSMGELRLDIATC
jgi:phasin family protein